jgi:hypothetical protein
VEGPLTGRRAPEEPVVGLLSGREAPGAELRPKLSRHGQFIGRAAGSVLIALAVLVAVSPSIAEAVTPGPGPTSMAGM